MIQNRRRRGRYRLMPVGRAMRRRGPDVAPRSGTSPVPPERVMFSCLMDNKPKYTRQTFVLVWTMLDLAGVAPERILVQYIEGVDEQTLARLRALGVRLRGVEPFAEGYPHCNKLRQLDAPDLMEADVAVLVDTDIAMVGDVTPAASTVDIRARLVGGPNPPLKVLREIFRAAGFRDLPARAKTVLGGETTLRVNCNGGVYLLPQRALAALSTEWPRRAHWLMENRQLMPDDYRFCFDQVSFALSCHALGLDNDPLPLELNYQVLAHRPTLDIAPRVLHYHSATDESGLLTPTGLREVDVAIRRVNDVIRERERVSLPPGNATS